MAPSRARKRKSSPSEIIKSPVGTPKRSPVQNHLKITQRQKQQLIDNLQLEITTRARRLRAQYSAQAQNLLARLELRINRIPMAIRKQNMGELLIKHAASQAEQEQQLAVKADIESVNPNPKSKGKAVQKVVPQVANEHAPTAPKLARGIKRTSDAMIHADKENAPDPSHAIPNPKKRAKPTPASRQVTNPSTVLSPKSSNSRTLPQSPIRPPFGSPQKSHLSRPASPLKPASPTKNAALIATSTLASLVAEKSAVVKTKAGTARKVTKPVGEPKPAAGRAKRGAALLAESRTVSSSSNSSALSGTSTGTTVVRKIGKVWATANTTVNAVKKGVGIKPAPRKPVSKVGATGTGSRVLRKRA